MYAPVYPSSGARSLTRLPSCSVSHCHLAHLQRLLLPVALPGGIQATVYSIDLASYISSASSSSPIKVSSQHRDAPQPES